MLRLLVYINDVNASSLRRVFVRDTEQTKIAGALLMVLRVIAIRTQFLLVIELRQHTKGIEDWHSA